MHTLHYTMVDIIRADWPRISVPYAVLNLGGVSTEISFELVFDAAHDAALEELGNRPEYCLDLTYMDALPRPGYEFACSY